MTKSLPYLYKSATLLFFAWLILVNVFAYLSSNRLNLLADNAYEWMQPAEHFPPHQFTNFLDAHVKWDSLWYLDIAQNGYVYKGAGQLSNIVFFPVYPTIIALLGSLIPHALAGWIISILALLGAILLLVKYVTEHHPKIPALDVVFFLLIFPTAIFFNSVYTESLFLLLTIATFYFTLKRQFWIAGVFAFIAALTRVTGMLLVVPILIEYIVAMKNEKKPLGTDILSLALPPLGTAIFFLFHFVQFGDPFLFFDVQSSWGRNFTIESKHFLALTSASQMNLYLDLFFVAFAAISTVFVARRLRLSYAVFMLLGYLVPIITGTLMSVGRYIVVLFPLYLLAASIKNQTVRQIWILGSVLLFALYTILFSTNYWAG